MPLFSKTFFFKIPSYFNFFKKYYKLKINLNKNKDNNASLLSTFKNYYLVDFYLFKVIYLFFSKLNILYKSNNYLFLVSDNIFLKDFFNKLFDFDLVFKFFDISYFKFFTFRKVMSFSFLSNFVLTFKNRLFFVKFLRLFIYLFQNFLKIIYFNLEFKKILN